MNRKTNWHVQNSQSGNAFIYILVAIALFAALTYTFTRSAQQGGTGDISKQEAAIAASEILSYARSIEEAVNRVRVKNRCSENEISFEYGGNYVNASAPGTNKCHLFESAGGNIPWHTPQTSWLDSSQSSNALYGSYSYVGAGGVDDVESAASDLVFFAPVLNRQVCININNNLNISNPSDEPAVDDTGILTETPFTGSYASTPAAAATINDSGSSTALSGENAACIRESTGCNGGSCYNFYYVLLAR